MTLIADSLLIAGALAAAFYCWILSARVKSLKDLDTGLGGAIAGLSTKVDEMQAALRATQKVTGASRDEMEEMTRRAEKAAQDLSEMIDRVEAAERRSERRARQERSRNESARPVVQEDEEEHEVPHEAQVRERIGRVIGDADNDEGKSAAEAPPSRDEQALAARAAESVVQPLNRRRAAPAILSKRGKAAARDPQPAGGSRPCR